jgi:hypothetical protein
LFRNNIFDFFWGKVNLSVVVLAHQFQLVMQIEGRVMGLGHPDYANTIYLLAKVQLLCCCTSYCSIFSQFFSDFFPRAGALHFIKKNIIAQLFK